MPDTSAEALGLQKNPDTLIKHSESLKFTTSSGTKELNSNQLESWLARHDESYIEKIQLFGFKTPIDIVRYLNSEVGQAVQSNRFMQELFAEIELEDKIAANVKAEIAKEEQAKFLHFLGSIHKKEEEEELRLNEIIAQQNYERMQGNIEHSKEADARFREDMLKRYDDHYEGTASALEDSIKENQKKIETWDSEAENLVDEGYELEDRYKKYDEAIADFPNGKPIGGSIKDVSKGDLQKEIKELTEKQETLLAKTPEVMERGDDKEIRALLTEQNSNELRLAQFKDMLAVKKGSKYLVDDAGKPTKSLDEAAFVVSKKQKIVKVGDTHYLLNKSDKFEKLSDAEKAEAAKAFNKAKGDLTSIKNLVADSKKEQEAQHQHRVDKHMEKGKELHKTEAENTFLANQLNQVRSSQAVVRAELSKSSPDYAKVEAAQEVRTPGAKAADPAMSSLNQAYRNVLAVNGPLNQSDIDQFNSVVNRYNSGKQDVYGAKTPNAFAMGLRAGRPIPPLVRQRLENRLGTADEHPEPAPGAEPTATPSPTEAPTPEDNQGPRPVG